MFVRALFGLIAIAGVALMTRDLAQRTDAMVAEMAWPDRRSPPAPVPLARKDATTSFPAPVGSGVELVEIIDAGCGTCSGPGQDLLDALTLRYLAGVPLAYGLFALFRGRRDRLARH